MIQSLMSDSLSGERSESGKFKGEDQCQAQGGGQNKFWVMFKVRVMLKVRLRVTVRIRMVVGVRVKMRSQEYEANTQSHAQDESQGQFQHKNQGAVPARSG